MSPRIIFRISTISIALLIVCYSLISDYFNRDKSDSADRKRPGGPQDQVQLEKVAWSRLVDVTPFELTSSSNEPFRSGDLNEQVWIASFFFSTCPKICVEQNEQIEQFIKRNPKLDVKFVSVTVDPKTDTPDRLKQYAERFHADPTRWAFLTGGMEVIRELGENSFNVSVGFGSDKSTHSSRLFLVDRWGKFRDQFDWGAPEEMKRLSEVAQVTLDEKVPPSGESILTRNKIIGSDNGAFSNVRESGVPPALPQAKSDYEHGDWAEQEWIKKFTLTERSGELFHSDQMEGQVWVGSFFFSRCPSICFMQNTKIKELREQLGDTDVTFVSISTDPEHDTPTVLSEYAQVFRANSENWLFLTGDNLHIKRIGSEFFQVSAGKEDHSTELVLVDKWGTIRGGYDWKKPEMLTELHNAIKEAVSETEPPQPEPVKPRTIEEEGDIFDAPREPSTGKDN